MTKKELGKLNKQKAEERLHATAEWQEAERLIEEIERLHEAGDIAEAKRLCRRVEKLQQEARSKI